MSSFDPTNIGAAAVAATPPGQSTQYGLAYDLATGQWVSAQQFNSFIRDTVSQNVAKAAATDPALKPLHDQELAQAQEYAKSGGLATAKDQSWFGKLIHVPIHAYEEVSGAIQGAGNGDLYGDYAKKGGLLTKDEFNSFDPATQKFLIGKASLHQDVKDVAGVPGVSQAMTALNVGYRGLTTGAEMLGQLNQGTGIPLVGGLVTPWHISRLVNSDRWAQAWRESSDISLGNAVVNDLLNPYVAQDKLDQWRKHSSLYQLSSFGADLATSYFADPAVVVGKGVGASGRVLRNEMPLNESGGTYQAARQALQREQITVKNPVSRALGVNRANRMVAAQDNVEALAQRTTLAQFTGLADGYGKLGQMFRGRTIDGQPLAFAIHHAANVAAETGDRTLMDMTWRLAYADPKAFAVLNKWKAEAPEDLLQYQPKAQTFLDALDATKTRATQLEREHDDLVEAAAKADVENPGTFYNWSIHASLADKQADLKAAQDTLNKYDGYAAWLNSFSTPEEVAHAGGAANSTPLLSQVYAPKSAFRTVAKNQHPNGSTQRFFRDNPFGLGQTVTKLARAPFLQRANTINMHDLDSGPTSLSRQAAQLKQLFNYEDPEALDGAINAWHRAGSAAERERVVAAYEETHVARAAAQHFGVGDDVIRAVYNKVITEQNKFVRSMNAGQGVVYDAAHPGRAISLVDADEKAGTVTLRVMEGPTHVHEMTVPAEAWQEKALNEGKRPNSITQTANYYTPINHREFYLALKRDPELLHTLDASLTSRTKAEVMTAVDALGDRFNSLWKPWSLLRLGWPMRVLMDENMRALAVLGPLKTMKAYGPAYLGGLHNLGLATGTAIGGLTRRLAERKFYRDPFPLGDGPIRQSLLRDVDPIARSEEVQAAPLIPESMHEPIDYQRRAKIAKIVSDHTAAAAAHDRMAAWVRRINDQVNRLEDTRRHYLALSDPGFAHLAMPSLPQDKEGALRAFNDAKDALERTKAAAVKNGLDPLDITYSAIPEMPSHPAAEALNRALGHNYVLRPNEPKPPQAFDPISTNPVKSGWIVPLKHTKFSLDSTGLPRDRQLALWYEKHADMLSKPGHRIVVAHDGTAYVGRAFRQSEAKRAQRYLQHIADTHPDTKMWNLGTKTSYYVQDANDLTPITEAAYRRFTSETKPVIGEAPTKGKPRVVHGTGRNLPDQLLPKSRVSEDYGRMMGPGFYTTVDPDIAESYGHNIYTIKGARDGKMRKLWDADQIIGAEHPKLRAWIEAHGDEFGVDPATLDAAVDYAASSAILTKIVRSREYAFRQATWANLFEAAETTGDHGLGNAISAYLEREKKVGVITHLGGVSRGREHQVYIWLDPENLNVRPLYAPENGYHNVIDWFDHPQSRENVVPENRIVRTGTRNPMLRELKTQVNKLKANQIGTPEYSAALDRVWDLAPALGVDLKDIRSRADLNQLDPGAFDRMYEEAARQNAAHDAGVAANGELRSQENAVQSTAPDMGTFDFQIDSPTDAVLRAVLRRKEQGKGYRTIKSSDGKAFVVPKAFEGEGGEMLRAQVSSEKAIDSISDGHGRATEWGRRQAIGHKVYHAPDFTNPDVFKHGTKANQDALDYFGHWSDLVNNQIRQDPIYAKMLGGWSNDRITEWLTTTPSGARVRQELMHEGRMPELWVSEQRYRLNKYLPSPILQRRLAKGRLAPSDLRKHVANENLPDVFGPELDMVKKNTPIGRFLSRVMDGLWQGLGTRPIDALSRHPFAKAHYDLKMKALINSTDSKWLTNDQIAFYQHQASKFAEDRVKQHLWDLVDNTNFSDALRFVAPFWNAQQEALVKWARIISDRPEVVGRFMAANRAAYKNFAVVNENDEPTQYRNTTKGEVGVESQFLGKLGYHPNDRIIVPMPGVLKNVPGMGKMLGEVGSTGIPIGSANTVLQGENPLLPGFGPLVTIPADKFLRTMDKDAGGVTHDHQMWYRWLFPIGRPQDGPTGAAALNPFSGGNYANLLESIMPGYAKRVQVMGQDGPGWSNVLMTVGREKTLAAMEKGLKPGDPGWPTDSDIRKAAIWYQGLRIFSGLTSPVQTEFRGQNQMLIDEYRKYQQQYGQDALDNFIRDADKIVSQLPSLKAMVGKHTYSPILDDAQEAAALYTGSSSVSTAGVPPTDKGMKEFGQLRDLMSAYPDAGSAIISQDAYNDAFSSDAYYLQGQVDLGDADNTKLRSFPSYRARMDAAQAQSGWYEYRQVSQAINAELMARGLTSIQQQGASDLSALKRAFTADLRQRNTAWAAAFDQQNNNIYDWINEAQNGTNGHEGWVWDKRLDDRPDIKGFRQYLIMRQQVTQVLDQYKAQTGGSASLQGKDQFNSTVRNWFYSQVGALAQSNPAFAEFYSRYLDSDTLEQGSGGFGGNVSN